MEENKQLLATTRKVGTKHNTTSCYSHFQTASRHQMSLIPPGVAYVYWGLPQLQKDIQRLENLKKAVLTSIQEDRPDGDDSSPVSLKVAL